MSGKTRDEFYNKFALPIFLAAFAVVSFGGGGYIYSQTPEGEKQIAQSTKVLKDKKDTFLVLALSGLSNRDNNRP